MIFRYFEREKFNHSADKLALISPDVAQFIKLASGKLDDIYKVQTYM